MVRGLTEGKRYEVTGMLRAVRTVLKVHKLTC